MIDSAVFVHEFSELAAGGFSIRKLRILFFRFLTALGFRRKQSERTILKQSSVRSPEATFLRLFSSDMIGVLLRDGNGRILAMNSYLMSLLGWTFEELRTAKVKLESLLVPESRRPLAESLVRLKNNGLFPPFNARFFRRDGSVVPVVMGGAQLEGERLAIFATDLRVTQLPVPETHSNLNHSEQLLNIVVETLPHMIFIKDAKDLKLIRINKAGEDLLGCTRDQIMGKTDFTLFSESEARFFHDMDRQVLNSRMSVEIPNEKISTPKGVRYLRTKKIPILDDQGSPIYLLGISEDITDKKLAEETRERDLELRVARAETEKTLHRMQTLHRVSTICAECFDMPAMLKKFGDALVSEMVEACEVILLAEPGDQVEHWLMRHRDPQAQTSIDGFLKTMAKESWNPKDSFAGPALNAEAPEFLSGVTSEIIDSRIANPALREMFKNLGVRSAIFVPLHSHGQIFGLLNIYSSESESPLDLACLSFLREIASHLSLAIDNSRLYRKALEANHTKSAFLANMSHEIRTPLGAIIGFAELLSDEDSLGESQDRYLANLLRNGQHLMRIVDEVLDLAKIESGSIEIKKVEFSLKPLLSEVLNTLRSQARSKHLDFTWTDLKDLPERVVSDPTRLRQILINVIGNAIKFTNRGAIHIKFELRLSQQDGQFLLVISVHDTGIGITVDQRERLFQPFVQIDNSLTRRFGGTGLGLFLSQRLARMMGGDVALITSDLSTGSEFNISISLESAKPSSQQPMPPSLCAKSKTSHVLVVDDAADNRMLLQLYLSRWGVDVDLAGSGAEALRMALTHNYKLILMDVQMPEMNGFEVIQALRAAKYVNPVVALTAHTLKGDRERCLVAGFDDYIGKPIDRQLLKKIVDRYLAKSAVESVRGRTGPSHTV